MEMSPEEAKEFYNLVVEVEVRKFPKLFEALQHELHVQMLGLPSDPSEEQAYVDRCVGGKTVTEDELELSRDHFRGAFREGLRRRKMLEGLEKKLRDPPQLRVVR